MKKAVVSVVGKDRAGIISTVSTILYNNNVNILDISQTIVQDMFNMMMIVDISKSAKEFTKLFSELEEAGADIGVEIRIQLEDIFNAMHRI